MHNPINKRLLRNNMILSLLILCYVAALSSRSILSMLLFLVASYISAAIYLASYSLIYSALLYVLVYIGAIVVLFIYVIQLVNTDIGYTSHYSSRPMLIINSILILGILFLLSSRADSIDLLLDYSSTSAITKLSMPSLSSIELLSHSNVNNLNQLASSLFNDYAYILIIAVHAIVLAVIGPIKLALHRTNN